MAAAEVEAKPRRRVNTRALLIGLLVVVVIAAAAALFGWDLSSWVKEVWNTITTISIGYLIAGIVLITIQTTAAAFAWYSILRYAYPGQVRWMQVWASYAAAVALNFVLPANLGTLVMLLMFTTFIIAATFAGVVAGYVVQKVFFTAIGVATYLYLFLSVGGSFGLQFGFIEEHPWAFVILLVAIGVLIYLVLQTLAPADQRMVGRGEGRRTDRRATTALLHTGRGARARQLAGHARHDRGLPGRVQHPRHLSHRDERHRRQLDREHDVGDPGRRGRRAGLQRPLAA